MGEPCHCIDYLVNDCLCMFFSVFIEFNARDATIVYSAKGGHFAKTCLCDHFAKSYLWNSMHVMPPYSSRLTMSRHFAKCSQWQCHFFMNIARVCSPLLGA